MPSPSHALFRNGLRAYGFHQLADPENIRNSGFRIIENSMQREYCRKELLQNHQNAIGGQFHSLNFKALSLICVKFQFSGKRVPPTVKSDC